MNKFVGEAECRKVLDKCWKQSFDAKSCFPADIYKWIRYQSMLAGVPESYITWPLLVCTAYCSRHATVEIEAPMKSDSHSDNNPIPNRKKKVIMHTQPLILYALVVGRSGKELFLGKGRLYITIKEWRVAETSFFFWASILGGIKLLIFLTNECSDGEKPSQL